jgi:PAS domain S-box-containing protein
MASMHVYTEGAPTRTVPPSTGIGARARWLAPVRFRSGFRLGLRARLVLLVVLAGLPALLVFLYHAQRERADLIVEAQARALRLARAWAENHDALVREAHLLLLAASRDPATMVGTCETALRALVDRVNWSSPVALFRRDGSIVCGTHPDRSMFDRMDASFLGGLFQLSMLDVSEFALDPLGRSIAYAGLRIPAPGTIGGASDRVAVAVIDLAVIQQRSARDAEGAKYDIMVLDRSGTLLAREPQGAGLVGARLPANHPLQPALNVHPEGTAIGPGLDGIERIFAFTQLPQTGAKVAVGLARGDVIGAQEREQDWLIGLLLAVAGVATAAACLVGDFSVLRWLRVLDRAAEAFARGDLGHRAVVSRHASSELSRLAATVNRMAANLGTHTAALAASERRFRDIAEVSGDWIWERDGAGRSTYLSERFTEATGVPVEHMHESTLNDLIALGFDSEGVDHLRRSFDNWCAFRGLVHRFVMPDGAVQYWRTSGTPIFDSGGAFCGFRGTGSNITAAIEAADKLRAAKDAAEAASRAKSQFLASMSHELRTPLNAVIGFSELLGTRIPGPLSAKQEEYIHDIHSSGHHLLAIVDDILDIAKSDVDHLDLHESMVVLPSLLHDVLRLLTERVTRGRVAIEIAFADDARIIRVDERRFRQVLLNLVGNAVKFTPSGGRVQVTTEIDEPAQYFVMRIADTGVGIAFEDLARVTEPFWQGPRDFNRPQEGVGLGLSVSRRIVERHGGHLVIESCVGVGTTVNVLLPVARVGADA